MRGSDRGQGGGTSDDDDEEDWGSDGSGSLRADSRCPARRRRRFELVRMIFRECDLDMDDRLDVHELYIFAAETGFDEGHDIWQEEYETCCQLQRVDPDRGFDEAAFGVMLNDVWYGKFTDDELVEVLARLRATPLRKCSADSSPPENFFPSSPQKLLREADTTTGEGEDVDGESCESSADEALLQDRLDLGVAAIDAVPEGQRAPARAPEGTVAEEFGEVKVEAAGRAHGRAEVDGGSRVQGWWCQQDWWQHSPQEELPQGVQQWYMHNGIGPLMGAYPGLHSLPPKLRPSGPMPLESITERVEAVVRGLERDDEERQLVMNCMDDLQSLIRTRLPGSGWRVFAFGSAVNGFGAPGCDLDVVMCAATEEEVVPMGDAKALLTELSVHLDGFTFELQKVVLCARVPILKLSYRLAGRELEVDMSINNWQGLRNTRLLQAYSQVDPKVSKLGLAIKAWAKEADLVGATNGFLSSYALVLMVIYFLQVSQGDNALPCLQERGWTFESDRDVRECLKPHAQSPGLAASLGELYKGFFHFYARDFRMGEEVVSVRRGQRAPATGPHYEVLGRRHQPRLHIEDPFERSRNLRDVLTFTNETRFMNAIREVCAEMEAAPLSTVPHPADAARNAQLMGHRILTEMFDIRGSYGVPVPKDVHDEHRHRGGPARLTKKAHASGQAHTKEKKGRASGEKDHEAPLSSRGAEAVKERRKGAAPEMKRINAWSRVVPNLDDGTRNHRMVGNRRGSSSKRMLPVQRVQ